MTFNYNFEEGFPYEYEVTDGKRLVEGLAFCLVNLYAPEKKNKDGDRVYLTMKEHRLLWDTFVNFLEEQYLPDLLNEYEEDLKDYFEDDAKEEYEEYKSREKRY